MKKISCFKYVAIFFALFLIAVFLGGGSVGSAYAASSVCGSNVMTDFYQDGSFEVNDYPAVSDDYGIRVIQIAESTSGKLYLYTYQPCQDTFPVVATDINMSLTAKMGGVVDENVELTDEDKPKLYSLTFLNRSGVFCKYVVNGLAVSNDIVRYYNIASIYREYNEKLGDTGSTVESIIEKTAFEVGKLFIVKTKNGAVSYECQEKTTIKIINPFFDYLEYSNGFKLYLNRCRSHYVAFSTDKQIDFLMEADLSYSTVACSRSEGIGLDGSVTRGEPVFYENETIDYEMTGENAADGWFSEKFVWDRIEPVSDFIANENLKDSTINNLSGKQWVLRFKETSVSAISGLGSTTTFWTEVNNVTILRLKFVTNGVTYNLGAVSDMGHSDNDAGNYDGTKPLGFWEYVWQCIVRLFNGTATFTETVVAVATIFVVVALLPILMLILSIIFPAFRSVLLTVLKTILWVITAPFRFIAWLIHKIRGGD